MKNIKNTITQIILAVFIVFGGAAVAQATNYSFTVSCSEMDKHVEVWKTGDIDPGRVALKVDSGTRNPGCMVSDYNPKNDANLKKVTLKGPRAIAQAIPIVGPLLDPARIHVRLHF